MKHKGPFFKKLPIIPGQGHVDRAKTSMERSVVLSTKNQTCINILDFNTLWFHQVWIVNLDETGMAFVFLFIPFLLN